MSLPPSSPFKRFLDRFVPFLYRPVRRTYQWQGERRFQRRYRRLVGQITAKAGWQVQTGPFTGMHYIEEARSSALLPKLLGTYEDELHPTLEAFLAAPYPIVIDIGCAEGYYAVGLARRMPAAIIHAFDLEPKSRSLCTKLAIRNGVVDRVLIHDRFTLDQFPEPPAERLLVICDVDGFEIELFKPESTIHWQRADLIVELHDCLGLPCRKAVQDCLSGTHHIEVIPSRTKTPPRLDSLDALSDADRQLAVDELRPPQEWLIAIRKS
jgi:hypothetical protein